MFRFGATFFLVGLFVALMTRLTRNGVFDPADWREGAWILSTVTLLIALVLLILRGVWRSSPQVLEGLYWQTALAGNIVGLTGVLMLLHTLWLARQSGAMNFLLISSCGCVVLIGFLTADALWRTKEPGQSSS